jgi:hypothetical protein
MVAHSNSLPDIRPLSGLGLVLLYLFCPGLNHASTHGTYMLLSLAKYYTQSSPINSALNQLSFVISQAAPFGEKASWSLWIGAANHLPLSSSVSGMKRPNRQCHAAHPTCRPQLAATRAYSNVQQRHYTYSRSSRATWSNSLRLILGLGNPIARLFFLAHVSPKFHSVTGSNR